MKRMAVLMCVMALTACSSAAVDEHGKPFVPQHEMVDVPLDNGKKLPCIVFRQGYDSWSCDFSRIHG